MKRESPCLCIFQDPAKPHAPEKTRKFLSNDTRGIELFEGPNSPFSGVGLGQRRSNHVSTERFDGASVFAGEPPRSILPAF